MSRLSIAIEGGLELPEGRVLVLRPPVGFDLSDLDEAHVVQGFKPAYDFFAVQGFSVALAPDGSYAAALVCVTRSKVETRGLIADAAQRAPLVLVDGQKTDGIESHLKDIKKRATVVSVVSKAHGKLFAFRDGAFADWDAPAKVVDGFQTVPGVFSSDGIDPASQMLAAHLPEKLPNRIADLGAGWGYLATQILLRDSVKEVHLVEAEHAALDCARRNVTDPRAQFHWADATQFTLPTGLDAVVMNPPFHPSRAADPKLGQAFIANAARILAPHGKLWMVANRHLPYEAEAQSRFAQVTEIAGDNRFKVLLAEKPRRARR